MAKTLAADSRPQTWREELANSVSAGIGLLAVMAGIPLLVSSAVQRGDLWSLVGTVIFALAMASLYLVSTIYHAVPQGRTKEFFHLLDHSAIYVLIAGTYTPFALGTLRGAWGWTLFGVAWSLAALGIFFKVFAGLKLQGWSLLTYLGMGWMALPGIRLFMLHIQFGGLLWILAGGVAYTCGVVFYVAKRVPYSHFIWHLFVIAGTACHFCAVLWYSG